MPRPALIIGSEPRVIVTVARSLASHGISVHAGNFRPEPLRTRSRAIDRIVELPSAALPVPALASELESLIQRWDYDIIFPCSDTALSTLMKVDESLRRRVHLASPDPSVLVGVLDKQLTLDAAGRCGVPTPRQWRIQNLPQLENAGLCFPLVAKPVSKARDAAFKVRYFQSLSELRVAFSEDAAFGSAYLLQQYCTGRGVGIEILIHEGEPVAIFQHLRLREFPASGGVSVTASAQPLDPVLAAHALHLLHELKWDGIAMVEFRHDPLTGAVALMEVNGRYWGSLALSRHAGLEFPLYQWQLAHGETPVPPAEYRTDATFHWLVGDLRRAVDLGRRVEGAASARLRETLRQLRDSVRGKAPPGSDALWLWHDPMPATIELAGWALDTCKTAVSSVLRVFRRRPFGIPLARIRQRSLKRREARLRGVIECLTEEQMVRLRRIVFVCHGNIMRSAVAEGLLLKYLAGNRDYEVTSAGVFAKQGTPPDERAVSFAARFGVDIGSHRSRRLTAGVAGQADMIFVMDYDNGIKLLSERPELKGRVALLSSVLAGAGGMGRQIEDPYLLSPTRTVRVLRTVDSCVRRLAEHLWTQSKGVG